MTTNIKSIAIGEAQTYTFGEKVFESAYKKDKFFNQIEVKTLGLLGDKQVDGRFHGGFDKAIHFGSFEHIKTNQELDKLFIGCNILVEDFTEEDICIGDIYNIGEIRVEVTQPRQPCWKIGALFGKEAKRFISQNHATGWYVRVLEEGNIKLDDKMTLEKRVSNITIKELSKYLIVAPEDRKIIHEIIGLESLAESYRRDFLYSLDKNNS